MFFFTKALPAIDNLKEKQNLEMKNQIVNTDYNEMDLYLDKIRVEQKENRIETNSIGDNSQKNNEIVIEEGKNNIINNKGTNHDIVHNKQENNLKINQGKTIVNNVKLNKNHQRNLSVQNSTLYTLLGLQTRNK